MIEPEFRIRHRDATSDLQSARPGSEGLTGGSLITRAEHDNMPAGKIILPIHGSVVRRGVWRRKIGLQGRRFILQGGTDNLFDSALM